MATLSGQTIANTFDSILHVEDDTAGLVATAVDSRVIQDGVGQSSALALATDSVRITSTNKLYFNDAGAEEIHSASDGHLEVNSGTTLDITAPTVDINASTAVTVDGPAVTIADGTGSKPLIIVKNTANDTTGSELRFVMDKGSAGADGDDLGTISFYGDDAGQNQTAFAKIVAEVSEADETDEAGKLSFYVAESDGTDTALTAGLILEGEHATDGEVDVTIGAGASSTTTIAGNLVVTGSGAGITHDGSTADGVLTYKDADEATVEANLTFGSQLLKVQVSDDTGAFGSTTDAVAAHDGSYGPCLFLSNTSTAASTGAQLVFQASNTSLAGIGVAKVGGTANYCDMGFVVEHDGTLYEQFYMRYGQNNGFNTITPAYDLDVNGDIGYEGSIADYSLRRLKEDIEEIDGSGFIEKFKNVPFYRYKYKPHINCADLKNLAIEEFGKDRYDEAFPYGNSHGKMYDCPDAEMLEFLDTKAEEMREEKRTEYYNKHNLMLGLIADDPELLENFPEVVAWRHIDDSLDYPDAPESVTKPDDSIAGINPTAYIGMLHGVIRELVGRVEALENE